MTAPFPDLTLEQVADWSAANGFSMLEVACWPAAGGQKRRYAGTCHIDVDALDPDAVGAVLAR
ncbi:MAG: sugar phosphate isomerase/epimerase, partial [Actinobacteria bacterium]|nr:sugar phosphate isomerase/epimerase [Actinomycetota bacterium]